MQTEKLFLYLREDGVFLRLSYKGERQNAEVRGAVSSENVRETVTRLVESVLEGREIPERSLTAVFTVSKMTEILAPTVRGALLKIPAVDAVALLKREEVSYSAQRTLLADGPRELLFCGARETRLFTADGEVPMPHSEKTGGNGFHDWLLTFAERPMETLEDALLQTDRLAELFRVYRAFPAWNESDERTDPSVGGAENGKSEKHGKKRRIFPDCKAHPILAVHPADVAQSDGTEEDSDRLSRKKKPLPPPKYEDREPPILYYALTAEERKKVDRKFPALYRTARDGRGNYLQVSIGAAADAFRSLFGEIDRVPMTALTVVGRYARFPLVRDLLLSLPQGVAVEYASESALMLDGLERATHLRMRSSCLSLGDVDGDAVPLWGEGDAEEKRVSFEVTLRAGYSREEWKVNPQIFPYTLLLQEERREKDGTFVTVTRRITGDLKRECYRLQKDGSYRLAGLARPSAGECDPVLATALIGVSATPSGVRCHLFTARPADPSARLGGREEPSPHFGAED